MNGPRRRDRVALLFGVGTIAVGLVVGTIGLAANWPQPTPFAFPGWHVPVAVSFGSMAFLVLRRRPDNRIGWLLLAEAVLTAVQYAVDQVAVAGVRLSLGGAATWVAWLSNWIWLVAISLLPVIFLLFPDGHALSRRWSRLSAVLAVGVAVAAVGVALVSGPLLPNYPSVPNPAGVGPDWWGALFAIGAITTLVAAAGCVLSLVIRWRRSTGDGREQLKWLAFVGIPMVVVGAFVPIVPIAGDALVLFGVAMPVAIAIAILRHRLYDIDELIGRTFVYGALTAILAGVYTAALKLFNELFVQLTGGQSESSIILATLVLAAAFTPVRKALEGVVERRFKPSKPGDAAAATLVAAPGTVAALTPVELENLVRRAVRAEITARDARRAD